MVRDDYGTIFRQVDLSYKSCIFIQIKARNNNCNEVLIIIEHRVCEIERYHIADPSYVVFTGGKVLRPYYVLYMFPVCQVYVAGFERHGSSKHVPVRCYSQYDGIEWITVVHLDGRERCMPRNPNSAAHETAPAC